MTDSEKFSAFLDRHPGFANALAITVYGTGLVAAALGIYEAGVLLLDVIDALNH